MAVPGRAGYRLAPSLTCHCQHREGAHTSSAMEPVEVHLVFSCRIQVKDGDLALVSSYRHLLGLPVPVLVLDHEGVELSIRDHP